MFMNISFVEKLKNRYDGGGESAPFVSDVTGRGVNGLVTRPDSVGDDLSNF